MFGDNSREALGLTINYNKAPDVSQDFLVSALQNSCAQWDLYMFTQLEVTAAEVKRRLDAGEVLNLIDVREPDEYQVCRIDGATLIPMRQISQQFERLEETTAPLIVFCHHGVRSLNVVEWLREQGLSDCQSMAGGIDAWSREVDPAVARY
jgi:rhodanese-related sulfurtransferase